ncbi:MAG: hypothetical protein HRU75_03020 [Planctomycetia bacterium]|nr:MAG: hypothetical protein HRU75_03020 [Planctomycetia bacterium]
MTDCLRIGIVAAMLCASSVIARGQSAEREEPPDRPRTVTVTAEGYNRDDALKQALRKALEQGAGVQIAGFSEARDFALVRDTIYSRASGIVSDYRVQREESGPGGTVIMTVEATVRPSAVAAAWGEVQNVLDQIGRPKIMVWIEERIDGQLQSDSIVERRLEERLTKAGFDLVSRAGVADLLRRESADAEAEGNAAKLARIAKDAGAHILIRGSANANRSGLEDIYGSPAAFYNCDASASVYYTDSARVLASESVNNVRKGARSNREFSPQAARAALIDATLPEPRTRVQKPPLGERLLASVMEQWATQISAGGEIVLEIEELDFRTFTRLKRALSELEGVRSADGDFSKRTGVFRLRATVAAQNLAERLTDAPFDEWMEVIDLSPNRIQARAVKSGDASK